MMKSPFTKDQWTFLRNPFGGAMWLRRYLNEDHDKVYFSESYYLSSAYTFKKDEHLSMGKHGDGFLFLELATEKNYEGVLKDAARHMGFLSVRVEPFGKIYGGISGEVIYDPETAKWQTPNNMDKEKKTCVISYAKRGRENYVKAQLNLIKSCKPFWDGDYLMYAEDGDADEYLGVPIVTGKYPQPECLSPEQHFNHAEIPYGFKPNLFQIAREQGYEQVIWCDSTIRMLKNPQPLLDYAAEHGVACFDNLGHPLKYWISDLAVERSGLTPEELETAKQIMACVIIFDFTNPVGVHVFEEWWKQSRDGVSFQNYTSTREGFRLPRHDQAALSAILAKEKIELLPYGKLVYPPHHETKEYGSDIYFLNKGVI